jgi:hypothetical protein
MKYTCEELARMIDHPLLHPTLAGRELEVARNVQAPFFGWGIEQRRREDAKRTRGDL